MPLTHTTHTVFVRSEIPSAEFRDVSQDSGSSYRADDQ